MVRTLIFSTLFAVTAAVAGTQDPFVPLDFTAPKAAPSLGGARADWVKLTNQRMEMAGRTLRVAQEGDGLTAVFLVPGVAKARHAKPYLLGKGDQAALFKSAVGLGFTRLVVRDPGTGRQWAARLEQGKAVLED